MDDKPRLSPIQGILLSRQAMTFALGSHFNCPPHMWDDQTPERVMLDFMIVRAANDKKAEVMERMKKEAERKMGTSNKGQPLRTTSHGDGLVDFFEIHNQKMRDE